MKLEIRELEKKDYKKAAVFAGIGMHFEKYFENKIFLKEYSKCFLYEVLNRATQVIAAYYGNELAGVLIADIKGKEKKFSTFWTRFYFKIFHFVQDIIAPGIEDTYLKTNEELFAEYKKKLESSNEKIDGELMFFSVNPKICGKGIGSALLLEFEKREKGKRIFLYTDDACSYHFYEKRGFRRECERTMTFDSLGKKSELKCFLYSKVL